MSRTTGTRRSSRAALGSDRRVQRAAVDDALRKLDPPIPPLGVYQLKHTCWSLTVSPAISTASSGWRSRRVNRPRGYADTVRYAPRWEGRGDPNGAAA